MKIIIYDINLNEIDLDNSNIKNKPFKLITEFKGCSGNSTNIKKELNEFFGTKFENKILDEIKKYVPDYKTSNKLVLHISGSFSQYNVEEQIFLKLCDYYYSYLTYYSKEKFQRIDWIYSKNFDRIFIGFVKNVETYLNSLIYNINTVDKLLLNKMNNNYLFKILLKDGNNVDICEFTKEKENTLNKFIFLINGQINDRNDRNNNNSDNSAPNVVTVL